MPPPFDKNINIYSPTTGDRTFAWYTRTARGDRITPLPYTVLKERASGIVTFPFSGVKRNLDAGNYPGSMFIASGSEKQALFNKVYGQFMQRVQGQSAQLGATIGEFKSSARMIESRANQLERLTHGLLRKWQRVRGRGRWRFKTFADYWLEYSFGWSPLLNDIWSAADRMTKQPKPIRIRTRSSIPVSLNRRSGTERYVGKYLYSVLMFGKVNITNPNVALAADLGLLNPAAVAWELVRWSFVADWLFDVSSCIGSFSDSFGREYFHTGVTETQFGSQTWTSDNGIGSSTCIGLYNVRTVGPLPRPLPNLAILTNIGSSLRRAVNAIALTVQLVSTGKPIRPSGRR
mgnify:CR=1 FL=1